MTVICLVAQMLSGASLTRSTIVGSAAFNLFIISAVTPPLCFSLDGGEDWEDLNARGLDAMRWAAALCQRHLSISLDMSAFLVPSRAQRGLTFMQERIKVGSSRYCLPGVTCWGSCEDRDWSNIWWPDLVKTGSIAVGVNVVFFDSLVQHE